MKQVIIDKNLFDEISSIAINCDSFCAVLKCSLFKLHENSEVYACLRSSEGAPCNLYVSSNEENIKKQRGESEEKDWIEVVGKSNLKSIFYYHLTRSKQLETSTVICGTKIDVIDKTLCKTMERLSTDKNTVDIVSDIKSYGKEEEDAFQKRSVIDLSAVDSRGVNIVYFEGADKLIEKLLYGGCREITVFITDKGKAKEINNRLKRISKKAPFSNRITVVTEEIFAPKSECIILVGDKAAMFSNAATRIFISYGYASDKDMIVFVGQNTESMISHTIDGRIKSHAIHYVTSIMSELILHAITTKQYSAKRLFKVNANTLNTETIIKED